jgi:hypothetical protein
MHSRTRLLLLALLVGAGTLALAWDAAAQEPVTSRLKLSIGGYIKPEFIYRTNNGGIGFAGSIPGAQNFGFSITPQKNTIAGSNGQFIAAANETRMNFTLNAPDWRGLKSLGFLEVDFEGDTASTVERLGGVAPATGIGNSAGSINNGALRIRHAFFRLSGEGLGGQWSVTFGQTWNVFGMLPFYAGASLSFGGASLFGGRNTQLRFQHDWNFARDWTWQNAVSVSQDTTNLNETPGIDGYSRFIWRGWQGWQGGTRTPISAGISARVQREKADVYTLTPGSALANTQSQASGTRSISATAWGLTGGLFVPILPGRSATDRTWGLSVVSEGGYGSGINAQAIPGTNPLSGALTVGSPNRADAGAVYFKPSSCAVLANPPSTTAVAGTGVTVIGAAANACNATTAGGAAIGAGQIAPTELSLINTPWASYNIQFYLPWGFWISGGQKWIWFTNADNAFAQTCFNPQPVVPNTPCGSATNPLITPGVLGGAGAAASNQGQFNPAYTFAAQPASNPSAIYGSRDAQIKRLNYNYVALFYDMTPNIRLGFEWGLHDTARKNSNQDNQSNRWQFGGYFFF